MESGACWEGEGGGSAALWGFWEGFGEKGRERHSEQSCEHSKEGEPVWCEEWNMWRGEVR